MSEAVAVPSGIHPGMGMSRLVSDGRLALRAAGGDERAFATIFDRYQQPLYRYCLSIVGSPHDAQDALQNTMVKVLRALPGEERQIQLKPWLYRIAHNESIELLRRRRDTRELDAGLETPGPGLAEEAASRERLRRLISDLDELPERQRGALVMRELAGLEFAEIGAALHTSAQVARQTVYEARLGLRQMDEGREMSCETVTRAVSDADGRVMRRRDVRAHLRACPSCRRFREEIEGRERDLAALSPLPAAMAAGLLQGVLGGNGGGVAGALGTGAAKSLGASAVFKGAATVAVVAAIGVGAADRGGLIDVGGSGGGSEAVHPRGEADHGTAATVQRRAAGAAAIGAAGSAEGAKGKNRLAASRALKPAQGNAPAVPTKATTRGSGQAHAHPVQAPASQGVPATHPHGRGHAKQLPSASAHGQETAAEHKAAGHGSAGAESHPAHPSHPPHPPHPAHPPASGAEKGPPPAPPGKPTAPEAQPGDGAATEAAGGEEASPGKGAGKGP